MVGNSEPLRLAVAPASVSAARQVVAETLADHGLDRHTIDVKLAASELVTNAVQYATDRLEFRVAISNDAIRLEVLDDCNLEPVRLEVTPESSTGRGLLIVDAVANEWGYRQLDEDGKVVWARFDL